MHVNECVLIHQLILFLSVAVCLACNYAYQRIKYIKLSVSIRTSSLQAKQTKCFAQVLAESRELNEIDENSLQPATDSRYQPSLNVVSRRSFCFVCKQYSVMITGEPFPVGVICNIYCP